MPEPDFSAQSQHEGLAAPWRADDEILHSRLDTIEALSRATHDSLVAHMAEERGTRAAVDELIVLWRGSKMILSAFKILIPIVAALVGGAMWVRDHVRW